MNSAWPDSNGKWCVVYHGRFGPKEDKDFYNVVGPFKSEKKARAEQRRGAKNASKDSRWELTVRARPMISTKESHL